MDYEQRKKLLTALQRYEDGQVGQEETARIIDAIFPTPPRYNCYELNRDDFGEYVTLAGERFYRTSPE